MGGVIARDRTGLSLRLELAAYPCEVRQCGVALADQLRERRADRFLGRTGGRTRGRRAFLLGPRRGLGLSPDLVGLLLRGFDDGLQRAMKVPTTSGLSPRAWVPQLLSGEVLR